ncbi:MAG: response regulator [Burkholderiales bacterium]|nr:response regulator [Burkholderiales bacterium]
MQKRPHILIAEDDRIILLDLSDGLSRAGYRVTTASNGEIAWQSISNELPDLILLDIRMPIMDGLTLAKRVRKICDVPIIFLTAYSDDERVSESVAIGGYGYLVKPMEVHQIIPSLELALARCEELRALKAVEVHLQSAVQSSRDISVAIGILRERHGLGHEEAFQAIRTHSRNRREKMDEIAARIVSGTLRLPMPKTR